MAPGARVEQLASGFGFVEGPVAGRDGALYFSDIPNNRIHRWTPDQGVALFEDNSGGGDGLRFDHDGNLVVCEMTHRRVTTRDDESVTTVLAERFGDRRFNSPNDLWIDPRGGIYFTDPRYGQTDDQEIAGYHVCYVTPDRSEVRRVTDDLERPNGIIETADSRRLYIADRGAGRTYVYTVTDDGRLTGNALLVAQGSHGMIMDERGNVYLTGQDITVYALEMTVSGQ